MLTAPCKMPAKCRCQRWRHCNGAHAMKPSSSSIARRGRIAKGSNERNCANAPTDSPAANKR
eukprot:3461799-Lingulodinium_polyedra.AAC.1